MIVLVLCSNNSKGVRANRSLTDIEVLCDDTLGLRERRRVRTGIVYRDAKSEQVSELSQSFRDAAMACYEKLRLGQDRFDENVNLSSAGHPHPQNFFGQVQGDKQRRLLLEAS